MSIIATTIGISSISYSYIVMKLGYGLGSIVTMAAALLSAYTANTQIKCAVNTNRFRFEDITLATFGPKSARFASFLNLSYLVMVILAFLTYLKHAIPDLIIAFKDDKSLNDSLKS